MNMEPINKVEPSKDNYSLVVHPTQPKPSDQSPAPNTQAPAAILAQSTTLGLLVDKATGLVQNITKNALTNEVIRKMPSDEYLKLLHSMSDVIGDALDSRV